MNNPLLNAKQSLFVQEYLIDKNATRAAKAAGYSAKSAYSVGHENLRKPDIKKAIELGLKAQADKADVSADRVLQELAAIAFSEWPDHNVSGKLRALELLGKHLGLFTNKVEVTSQSKAAQIVILPSNGREVDEIVFELPAKDVDFSGT